MDLHRGEAVRRERADEAEGEGAVELGVERVQRRAQCRLRGPVDQKRQVNDAPPLSVGSATATSRTISASRSTSRALTRRRSAATRPASSVPSACRSISPPSAAALTRSAETPGRRRATTVSSGQTMERLISMLSPMVRKPS